MFTAILIRVNGSVRVFGTFDSNEEALEAINYNWQHRNTPGNVNFYLVVDVDNSDATVINPNTSKAVAVPAGPTPKRAALVS